jgi:2-dehydropantoate 2-reductase
VLPAGERGEVWHLRAHVITGYENNPEANATAFFEGSWFRTGDQGTLDENGYLTLWTRTLKEMINRGGEKISPREIDEVLLAHPSVAEAVCFRRAAPHVGRGGASRGPCERRRSSRGRPAGVLQGAARRLQAAEEDLTSPTPSRARRTGKIQRRRGGEHYNDQAQRPEPQRVADARSVRIVIAGAGAIGGYIGAKLAKAGADVVLFARGPHLRAMEERGLRVLSPRRATSRCGLPSTGDLATIGYGRRGVPRREGARLTALAPALRQALRTATPSSSARRTASRGGTSRTTAASWRAAARARGSGRCRRRVDRAATRGRVAAYFFDRHREPGVIHHTEGNRLSLGEPNGTRSERGQGHCRGADRRRLARAGHERFRHEIWVKLLGNVAFNPISALTGGTLEQLVRHPETASLVREIMAETEAVAGSSASSCRSRSTSGWPAPKKWWRTRRRCCRISKPAADGARAVVGRVIELGDRLGVPDAGHARPCMPARNSWTTRAPLRARHDGGGSTVSINNRWFQLCASLVAMIMIANLQYAWTLFVQPMQGATGWKLSDIQFAFTLFILCQTWVQPLDGWLIDRLGPRGFISAAGLLCGLGGRAWATPRRCRCCMRSIAWPASARPSSTAARSARR